MICNECELHWLHDGNDNNIDDDNVCLFSSHYTSSTTQNTIINIPNNTNYVQQIILQQRTQWYVMNVYNIWLHDDNDDDNDKVYNNVCSLSEQYSTSSTTHNTFATIPNKQLNLWTVIVISFIVKIYLCLWCCYYNLMFF